MQGFALHIRCRIGPAELEGDMFATIASKYDHWRRRRRTQRILDALDARTLKDVGLVRCCGVVSCEKVMLRTLGMR